MPRTVVLFAGGLALIAAPAQALDRRVRLVNDSKHAVTEFYGSKFGDRASGDDMLGDDDLPPGGTLILNFEDGSGYCRFAFRAVFDDGKILARKSVNVCEVGTVRYTE